MPALAVVISEEIFIITSSVDCVHAPLRITHLKVTEVPGISPLTLVLFVVSDASVAVPLITVHVPIPTAGIFALSVVDVVLHRF